MTNGWFNWKPRMTQLKDIIAREGRHFVVSTADTMDAGFETMVFECDADGENVDYHDLYCDRYDTELAAAVGHTRAINNFQPPPPFDYEYDRDMRDEEADADTLRSCGCESSFCSRCNGDDKEDNMTDAEADADVLASAGWGTDEDYGYHGDD